MQLVAVTVERQNSGCPPVTVEYKIGETIDELLAQFGDTVSAVHLRRSILNSFGNHIRAIIDKGAELGLTYQQIIEEANKSAETWKPGRRRASKTPKEKVADLLAKLSPSERMAIFKDYEANPTEEARGDSASLR